MHRSRSIRQKLSPSSAGAKNKLLSEVSKALLPLSSDLRRREASLPNVITLTKNTHLALYSAIIHALGDWPDTELPRGLLYGMPIVGDIPDTRIFKPVQVGFREPLSSFTSRFCAATTANKDAQDLESKLRRRAVDESTNPVASNTQKRLAEATDKEVDDLLTGKAFPITSLVSKYMSFFRVMPCFGILQPADTATGDKLRAIDDARPKTSRSNDLNRMAGTVVMPSVEFFAVVAAAFHHSAKAMQSRMPNLSIGLDDVLSAYRRIPNRQPGFAEFALWNPATGRVDFQELFGLNFGLRSSVTNFFRIPRLICRFARLFFGLPLETYIDDFLLCDIQSSAKVGEDCLAHLCRALGLPLATAKHKAAAASNIVALGVQVDLSNVSHKTAPSVSFSPTPAACKFAIDALRIAKSTDYLPPGLASRPFGKLSWITSAAVRVCWKIGRAALQPLMQRVHCDKGTG